MCMGSLKFQNFILRSPPTIGVALLDLNISIFDQGNKKTGYLLDICMIVMWHLRDIAKLSSSGQVVMKFNLN